jgi:membrane-associated phospholipid phosphatase
MFTAVTKGIIQNAKALFAPRVLPWHALAIGVTAILALTGADWWFYTATREYAYAAHIWFAGLSFYIFIVFAPLSLYLLGEWRRDEALKRKAGLLLQAIILGALLSGLYKALTGRIEPPFMYIGTEDVSRVFQFGFFEYGVFWGWPSSHTTVTVAAAVALAQLFRSRVATTVLVYAAIVATGAALGFHWLSDVVAGAIFGTLVGYVVGRTDLLK